MNYILMKSKYIFSSVGANCVKFVECPSGKKCIYGPDVDTSKMTKAEWLRYLAAMRSCHKQFIQNTELNRSQRYNWF